MNCPRCATLNPVEARFCLRCGIALVSQPVSMMEVAAPFLEPPPQPPNNGVWPLSTLSQRAERRVVTVMFADLSGFTALSERMDPEQLRNLTNRCFDHLVPIIEKYGGVIDKFIGDEIMALFGAPVANEDDPARALRAALEMMAALGTFNERHETTLGMHIGLNSGLVVAGGMGSVGRQQYSVIGDTVNLAARLEDISDRGQILVGRDTYRRTLTLFDFETLMPVYVKGKTESVQVYQLLGVKPEPEPERGLSGLRSPLVGRATELATLRQVAGRVQQGQGQIALILGEAGLGKSRLVNEWRTGLMQDQHAPLQWFEGRCLSHGQGLAYHLLSDLVRCLLDIPATADEAKIRHTLMKSAASLLGGAEADLLPYLSHLLSLSQDEAVLEQLNRLEPQALQYQYLTALRRMLRTLAERGPTALVFEDVHWADTASVELLTELLPLVAELPLLFCFISRPDQNSPGWQLIKSACTACDPHLTEVTLHTLSEADSHQMIANLLEIDTFPDHIRTLILKRAEGNPFFVEEVTRMLIERGAIIRKEGRWVACERIDGVVIPENLPTSTVALIRLCKSPRRPASSARPSTTSGARALAASRWGRSTWSVANPAWPSKSWRRPSFLPESQSCGRRLLWSFKPIKPGCMAVWGLWSEGWRSSTRR